MNKLQDKIVEKTWNAQTQRVQNYDSAIKKHGE